MSSLKTKRGAVKQKLTIFAKYMGDFGGRTDLNDFDRLQIQNRLERIEGALDDFEIVQAQIEEETADIALEYTERENFTSDYFAAIALAKYVIKRNSPDVANTFSSSDFCAVPQQNQNIKLPTIQLPDFDGNYLKWLEFRDTYISLIHNNESISNIQKFHYLRASLSGGAKQLIQSLEFTSVNYHVAWELLLDRYNNKTILVHNHVKSLFELESVRKESAQDLRELIDNITKNLEALKQLNQPTDNWDTLIIYIVSQKLDSMTLREWENFKINKEMLSLKDFKSFLKSRAELLETINITQNKTPNRDTLKHVKGFLTTENNTISLKCVVCKGTHYIQNCPEFLKLSVNDRANKVKEMHLCLNCFRRGHAYKSCRASMCKKCGLKHHTLVHFDKAKQEKDSASFSSQVGESYVLLATSLVEISDTKGNVCTVRALLDSGSQASYITQGVCDRMKIETEDKTITVLGLNSSRSTINGKCSLNIRSLHSAFNINTSCFVVSQITENLPSINVNPTQFSIPNNIKLADPAFFKPNGIDLLIGAQMFWRVMCIGQIDLGPNNPILQKTRFGWVLSGPVGKFRSNNVCGFGHNDIQNCLSKFWELEEVPIMKPWSKEEVECEAHFVKHTVRNASGRFVVTLPLKHSPIKLGDSYVSAKNRFLSLEKRLANKPDIKDQYFAFIKEYQELGHMTKINNENSDEIAYYMPHHCVLKDSITTKLRVVFDASAPSTSGYSLNNLQMCGPVLQNTLFSILLRFRQHRYVIAGDIAKMYRQVYLNSEQKCLQRILWRDDPSSPIDTFELNTLTYGTTAASHLAIRCLVELANECKYENSKIADIISNDFYVDDMLTGADTIEEAASLAKSVADVLLKGCFELRKFYSNNPNVLKYVKDAGESSVKILNFDHNENTKILGLTWLPNNDKLKYSINTKDNYRKLNKRMILASVSQVFDPLGLISPVIISVKILLQQLWLEKLTWDEGLPLDITEQWINFHKDLNYINQLNIERYALSNGYTNVQIHGFCDSSQKAYGGAIYLRSVDENNDIHVHLLCAKSKVAPLKTITLPRLELCGALILTRLLKIVVAALSVKISSCTLWTDSTIVLGWLTTSPNKLTSFVSNRVAEIQELTSHYEWRHIRSKDNPADFLSRGIGSREIGKLDLWWHGPSWLKDEATCWPKWGTNKQAQLDLPEVRNVVHSFISQIKLSFPFDKFSDLTVLTKVMAWILRFKCNVLAKIASEDMIQKNELTVDEVSKAFKCLIKIAQANSFFGEMQKLSENKPLHHGSRVLSLNPFLDSEGLLRAGGRLEHLNCAEDKKHPIILCARHHLTLLIFRKEHLRLLHCGPQHLLASIRETFWPILGRNLAISTVRKCIRCFRLRPSGVQPIMGQLPAARIQSSPPFSITGVDYAGPLLIKDKKGRGGKISKCYIGLFICFSTKAVHLELISDLTKDCFLMALKRFVSRRGIPTKIFSDNGKNFVAARSELKELENFLSKNDSSFYEFSSSQGIEWKFIPPYSPHFGGLWEAGIKSAKKHLRAVMGNAHLTFEELNTLLVQVEAVLNSRPLTPMSADPNDLVPLTPSHFLIGRSLTAFPDRNLIQVPTNRLQRYHHIQQCQQHFWRRWHLEYIGELQRRSKWKASNGELQEGALVLLKDDNQPPLRWSMGRIVKLICGSDRKGRVAIVKTATGKTKRTFSKLCPLPLE